MKAARVSANQQGHKIARDRLRPSPNRLGTTSSALPSIRDLLADCLLKFYAPGTLPPPASSTPELVSSAPEGEVGCLAHP
ncbi:hypothetical protein E2562_014731 [Oryza meyeriana var. granulata]|uniref:Uncharacterized protein n=1 Tax=Oryza meyeriana var. granulata TaxID=110450 RepID=A0A6G1BL31_9ORYZ|nr:hypothetical protein E2562_014731 [Oryza meyeriana var. granulata]